MRFRVLNTEISYLADADACDRVMSVAADDRVKVIERLQQERADAVGAARNAPVITSRREGVIIDDEKEFFPPHSRDVFLSQGDIERIDDAQAADETHAQAAEQTETN